MANDELTVVRADGATKTLRSRDVGSAVQAQAIDVGPWLPTVVSGYQSLSVGTGSVVTLTVPSGATHVLLTVDGGDVRMREDAANPTTASGLILKDGFIGELPLPNALRVIGISTTCSVHATYRKYV